MTDKTLLRTGQYPIQLKLFNHLFDDVFADFKPFEKKWDFNPKTDVIESAEDFRIALEIPGMTLEEVEVTVEDGILQISGEKNQIRSEADQAKIHRIERSYGKFQRNFQIPDNVDLENIQATMKDGVLMLTLPKLKEAEIDPKRRIEIRAA